MEAYLGLKRYRILPGQAVYSSACGHFLTRMNYQDIAIAARATLSGGSFPLRSRRDAEQVKHAAIVRAEIDIVSLLVYARTDFHLAKTVGPIPPRRRHGDRRVEMMQTPRLWMCYWAHGHGVCLKKVIVCSQTLVRALWSRHSSNLYSIVRRCVR